MNTNINNILDSINEIRSAEPSFFFESKLKAKMQERFNANKFYLFSFKKPAYILAALLILFCLNVYLLSNKPIQKDISGMSNYQQATIDAFNNDYQLINNTSY